MKLTTKMKIKKYQNKIIGMAIIVLVVWGIVAAARPSPESNAGTGNTSSSSGKLTASEQSFDFGTISMAAGNVTRNVKVKNAGDGSITIKKLYTSCMCTVASMMKDGQTYGPFGMPGHGVVPSIDQVLDVGKEVEVAVTFDPAAHGPAGVGKISRVVYLENNAGKPLEIKFSAFVTP